MFSSISADVQRDSAAGRISQRRGTAGDGVLRYIFGTVSNTQRGIA